ncbi:MAG: hypothetical protein KZQ99_03435 [Candidatus Thiodiazotropha sp. (ex Dulcina madagascariensis)]|nr:hypothetical protein [Candidatus Thiodiazotropha sp. (ex Dulcina madagascariensis)]
MKLILNFAIISIFSAVAIASTDSNYSGLQANALKSLSNQEITGYLNGKGMGFSKVAELNHFPGPRHVIDLASELSLSKQQIHEANSIYQSMHLEAKKYGSEFVAKEREIEHLFLSQNVDSQNLKILVRESAELKGKIRLAHLKAHISQKQLLTRDQIRKYDEIRGYVGGQNQKHMHHH